MGGHKPISCSFPEKVTELRANYHVTGILSPDATGNYFKAGIHHEKPYYRRADGIYFIWWNKYNTNWYITPVVGMVEDPGWERNDDNIVGTYQPFFGATGIATVRLGPR